MARAIGVNYKDVLQEEGLEVAYGGSIAVFLDYFDCRFKNLSVLDVEGDEDFRKNCSVYYVYDVRDCNKLRLGTDIIYTDINGKDISIGELSEDERKSLEYWVLSYGFDEILKTEKFNDLNKEDFYDTYLELTSVV